jgi:isoquinoline 1-oxidoreductase beta subunit
VGYSFNVFCTEAFFDEVARAAGKDPFELRRALLAKAPRYARVLGLAAERAGWSTPPRPGVFRGIAVTRAFQTYGAQVAEVSVEGREVRVHRVVAAVDCGRVVNPDLVRAQVEGGIGFGLGAALKQEITLRSGRVEQSNFHDFDGLRMNEMPEIEVHIVASDEPPTGIGEPGVPLVAPAVANAILAATGRPVRAMPFRRALEAAR